MGAVAMRELMRVTKTSEYLTVLPDMRKVAMPINTNVSSREVTPSMSAYHVSK